MICKTPEERFNAAMSDPRLVDEATGFISDKDAATISAMVAHFWRKDGYITNSELADLGLAYWTALLHAQRRVIRGLQ